MNTKLELSPAEMRALGYRVVDLVADHLSSMGGRRVGTKADPAVLRPLLSEPAPRNAVFADEIFARLERDVLPNIMNICHPRFFAFVPGPSNFVSVMADALASGFNVFNGSWLGASGAAALELAVIDWFRQWCGFPVEAGGLFVSGGSMANLTALAAARHLRLQDRTAGAVLYYSDQTHSSIDRALRVIGFLPEQIRHIPSDPEFRLDVAALARHVAEDRAAGLRPFAVIANAGTTNTGAIDPLPQISAFCRAEDLWMHVDGAYGAAAVISDRGRAALAGIELCDSLSFDPHKWLFQPIECGCVLLRDGELLKSVYRIMPEYLADVHRNAAEVNPCDYGIQLTRGFRALKVWMSIQYFGMDAFRAAVARGFELAELAEAKLRGMPRWEIVTPAQMGIVTFRRRDAGESFYPKLHEAMLRDGFALATSTILNGRTVLRLCTINPRTTEAEIEQTLDWIDRLLSSEM
ncbi:MAG TPA: aminotransferase class I/II-fold pyridoxal phosphate-dependent enzyme [Bryobacteraceae bacterium]|nr:aminotransferase class I/II-fold pyridoxal phosphate-dependent enzyme [Bryobacteraceae bacterium]